MSSKILPPDSEARLQAPLWQQAGASSRSMARFEGSAEGEEPSAAARELQELRQRLAAVEASIPGKVEQARAEAKRAAEAEAAQRAEQARQEVARQMASSAAEMLVVRNQMRRQMEEDLVRLAVVVARRVVRRELAVDPSILTGIARAAVDQIEAREVHRIRVAARDAELIRRFVSDAGLPAQIQVVPDAALATGALVFETAHGTVDASVDVQLEEIDRGLADVVRRTT